MRTREKLIQKARRSIAAMGPEPVKKARAKRLASLRMPYAGIFRLVDGAVGNDAPSRALKLVFAERRRQVEEEGLTFEHDEDVNYNGELALAARCYLAYRSEGDLKCVPRLWPWGPDWWKPGYRRPGGRNRDLVKAGALLLAETDRLSRYGVDSLAMVAGEMVRLVRKEADGNGGDPCKAKWESVAVRELDSYLSMRPTVKGVVTATALEVLALACLIKE